MQSPISHNELVSLIAYDQDSGIMQALPDAVDVIKMRHADKGIRVFFPGGSAYAHRLAWLYVHKEYPGHLTHINGDTTDNRLSNLTLRSPKTSLTDRLLYDPGSKSCLRWKMDRGYGGHGAKAGSEAGTLNVDRRNGYASWMVRDGRTKVGAHRIVWTLCTGNEIPAGIEVDHINGIPTDNRIENLRLVTRSGNCRNCKAKSSNKTGIPGVHFHNGKGNGSFVASVTDHAGREKTKSFACIKYGKDRAKSLAAAWRIEQLQKLNIEGAGYTARHLAGGPNLSAQRKVA